MAALNETTILNMALGRIGAKRINDFTNDNESGTPIVHCRLHYTQTRDALLRSHWWRFARDRKQLSQNAAYTADTTTFEWTYAYDLPNDYLREWLPPWDDNGEVWGRTRYSYSLEGKQLLSNQTTMYLRYVRQVTDVSEFDPLFVEVLVLELALKMVMPLSQDKELWQLIYAELNGAPGRPGVMSQVRTMDKQETKTLGQNDIAMWNDTRIVGSGNPLKRYS